MIAGGSEEEANCLLSASFSEVKNKLSFTSPRKPLKSLYFSFCTYGALNQHFQKSPMSSFLLKHMAFLSSFLMDVFIVHTTVINNV